MAHQQQLAACLPSSIDQYAQTHCHKFPTQASKKDELLIQKFIDEKF
jgi:hypothetical protein